MNQSDIEERVAAALNLVEEKRWQEEWPKLARILHELDLDWSGDAAVRVWVILDDSDQNEWPREHTEQIDETIRESLRQAGVDIWPYIRFRGKAEQEALDQGTYDEDDEPGAAMYSPEHS